MGKTPCESKYHVFRNRLQTRVESAVEKKRSKLQQPKLKSFLKINDANAANYAVAQWVIAHDIPPGAMTGPYWKLMNQKLAAVPPSYKPSDVSSKSIDEMLPLLQKMVKQEVENHLKHRPDVGRSIAGDGVTKTKVPLIA